MTSFNCKKSLLGVLICASIHAQAESQQPSNSNMLPEIVVYGNSNKSLTSSQDITQQDMHKTPVSNGNITDYLRSNPHVRYEHSDQNGLQRGEIKPENISINGADSNQTAYFVDNVNVNNDLSIDSEIFDGAMQVVPGISSTQGYFFDANMLSKVEVQDHNISASLGGFMGGAVVAKTKQYSGQDHVHLKYRTTNSSWAKMNEDGNSSQILNKVMPGLDGSADLQPKYNKHNFSIMAEKGLSDNLGMVVGFSRRYSTIEQYRLIGFSDKAQLAKQNHKRLSENALLNFNWAMNDNNRIELSTRYSNYKEQKYFPTNYDNNVKDYHTAYGATIAWIHDFDSSTWTNTLAYDHFEDKRKSGSANVKIVNVVDENYDPLYDYEEGGYGNSKMSQENIHYSTELAIKPFDLGVTNHSVSIGAIYQATYYKFDREQDVHSSLWFGEKDNLMPLNSSSTPKGKVKTDYQNIVIYGEDLIKWNHLEFRPGIRIERDDYLKNNNIAPRFVTKYQPWDETAFSVGLNRYYGRSFASLKLTNEILKLNRDTTNIRDFQDANRLKTPHTDELSITLEQGYKNMQFKVGYIHRDNRDRIILKRKQIGLRPSGDPEYAKYYANGNDFGVDIYTFEVNNKQPWQIGKTYWNTSLGFDWLNTQRADLNNQFDPNENVYLDGKKMTRKAMQQKVNSSNEDWIARLGIDMAIPDYNITWSNKVYMKAPIKGYEEIDGNSLDEIARFRSYDYGSHTQWDTSLRWQPTISGEHSIYFQVDVLNVLNKTRKINKLKSLSTNSEYSIYTPGREFWLEVGYQF
ncbi:TonB-dependent receptor plug domain-containing protein [Pasteurella bettyae]|uniref:TonB-dependent receptor plug domain-containing protein n=1 Tax=Pasteurella bettyae TaxID=752 RepID=UPI003D2D87D9